MGNMFLDHFFQFYRMLREICLLHHYNKHNPTVMITMGKHKICDGTGECYRRYKKYYFASYDKVECKYNCQMKRCKKCNFEAPEWYFKQYTSGLCYECNKAEYSDEADSCEDDLRSDATVDSLESIDSLTEEERELLLRFTELNNN